MLYKEIEVVKREFEIQNKVGEMISKINEIRKCIKETINHRIRIHIQSNIKN